MKALPIYSVTRAMGPLTHQAWHCGYCHRSVRPSALVGADTPCPECGYPIYDARRVPCAERSAEEWEALRGIRPVWEEPCPAAVSLAQCRQLSELPPRTALVVSALGMLPEGNGDARVSLECGGTKVEVTRFGASDRIRLDIQPC